MLLHRTLLNLYDIVSNLAMRIRASPKQSPPSTLQQACAPRKIAPYGNALNVFAPQSLDDKGELHLIAVVAMARLYRVFTVATTAFFVHFPCTFFSSSLMPGNGSGRNPAYVLLHRVESHSPASEGTLEIYQRRLGPFLFMYAMYF